MMSKKEQKTKKRKKEARNKKRKEKRVLAIGSLGITKKNKTPPKTKTKIFSLFFTHLI